jgi:hypothetical protein
MSFVEFTASPNQAELRAEFLSVLQASVVPALAILFQILSENSFIKIGFNVSRDINGVEVILGLLVGHNDAKLVELGGYQPFKFLYFNFNTVSSNSILDWNVP